jgi:cytochrome P450
MIATLSNAGPINLAVDPFNEAFLVDPYARHAELRDAGAVLWLSAIDSFGMARHAEVKDALADPATFISSRGVGLADFAKEEPWRPPSLLLEADPPLHDRTRGLMNRIVALPILKQLRPIWADRADELVESLVAKRRFDAVTEFAEVFPMLVFPDTIGLPKEGREHLLLYAAATFNAFGPRNALSEQTTAEAGSAFAWIAEVCRRRSLTPGGWGMAVYEAADRGECTEAEAERLVRSFLSAGVDTTVNGIANMTNAFAHSPAEWDKLRARPSLAKKAFEESLRWDSTVQTFFRTTARDVEVAGVMIPEGAKVLLFLAAANRDPRRWADADRFDIDRVASGHVGFGFGIHQCLGQMVARMEADVLLEAMISRIKTIRIVGRPVRRLNNTLHALASLPIEIEPA